MKTITGREMCRILERKGWSLDRIKSSHHTYVKGDESLTVPATDRGTSTVGFSTSS